MYICNECGLVFEEPYVYEERHGLDHPPYEKWSVCPRCRETNFCEAQECKRCGTLCGELNEGLCDVCYEDMNYE
jgi:hypothetical protein